MIHLESDIACDFAEWVSKYDWVFMADRNYWVNDDSRLHPKKTKQLFQEYLKDIEQKQKGELPPLAKEKYKFTEEDMRKSFQCGQQWVHDITNTDKEPVNFNDFIQSLSQPKMPTAFTETEEDDVNGKIMLPKSEADLYNEIERRRKMFHWYDDGDFEIAELEGNLSNTIFKVTLIERKTGLRYSFEIK